MNWYAIYTKSRCEKKVHTTLLQKGKLTNQETIKMIHDLSKQIAYLETNLLAFIGYNLEDILVTEEMRGKKIGSLLFDALIQEAKDKKFMGMNWQVLDWNEPAINFYKKYNASFDPEWLNCSMSFNQK